MTAPIGTSQNTGITPNDPLDIKNISYVDDNGGEHVETQMTGAFLVDLYEKGQLVTTGNIRPAHNAPRLLGKTRTKVNKWTEELLSNEAIIGNISVRLDPTKSDFEFWDDDETGSTNMTINSGVLDCAVDSLSRIKAILAAADNSLGSFKLGTRFQVRIWMLDDEGARKVATIYNTRGDKVNDSTAKYAYSESKDQELARRLVNGSAHLGQDNVEVLTNSVSASSHKLVAFNTISTAIETLWKGGPVSQADVDAQSSWLISAWDSLVQVRPEFGKISTPARQEQRAATISSTAVIIHGIIGTMSTMYSNGVDPDVAFQNLAKGDDGGDVFAWGDPRWTKAGVVAPTGSGTGKFTTRNSFPARRAATRELQAIMGLAPIVAD